MSVNKMNCLCKDQTTATENAGASHHLSNGSDSSTQPPLICSDAAWVIYRCECKWQAHLFIVMTYFYLHVVYFRLKVSSKERLMKIASLDVQRHLTLDTSCIGWKWMACKRRRVGYHKIVCVLIFLHDYNLKNVTESLREIRVSKKSLKKSNLT